jgi:parallel beta-helix repeat protein
MNLSSLRGLASFPGPLVRSTKRSGNGPRGRSAERGRRRGLARVEQLEARRALTVNVTTLDDAGAGSLRQAILDVNAAAIADTIVFNNLAAGTITLASELPTLTNPAGTTFSFGGTTTAITLDGASTLAADGLTVGAGANSVVLNGLNLTLKNFDSGLKFLGGSTGSTIKGLTISGNANGIELVGGSFSGTVISGNTITLNDQNGIVAAGGVTSLTIGGTTGSAANAISFNGSSGVAVAPGTYTNTKITGNVISSNARSGIFGNGGAAGLTIGGTATGAGNTIISNNEDGVFFDAGTYTGTVIQGNTISSNGGAGVLLGTSGGGLTGLTLGGATAAAVNTISFNRESGVEVSQGTFTSTVIQGNTIASNAAYGIQLSPGGQTLAGLTIGGSATGQGNTISSNALDGIGVFGGTYTGTTVQGNTIRYNLASGVNINTFAAGGAFGGLQVGGGAAGAGNTISSNGLDGVMLNAGVYVLTAVQGNTITSNGRHGVNFYAPFGEKLTGLALGGSGAGEGNTIQNNTASGLAASKGDYTLTTVAGNTISGNATGISLTDTRNLAIGGTIAAQKNTVSGNTTSGLFATGTLTATKVRGNAFSSNTLGVSLQDAQGLSLGTAEAGGGNAITGGTTGLRAVGNLSNSLVAGNTVTGQTTGIELVNATAVSGQPFFVGGAATTVGNGVGNYVASTVHGLYAAGAMTNTTIGGNIFSASASGGNAMVLVNATGLTVGGSAAGIGNTLTAAQGNGLFATGLLTGTGFYRNTLTASTNGVVLSSARNFLFGVANNSALGNTVQYNKVGLFAVGTCTGSGVCYTTWLGNTRKISNTATGLVVFPTA